jgi:glutathione S-transferase
MLELYHNNISVCAQKVRIVLAEKNVPWTNRYLSLAKGEQLTPQFKAMNPRGVVPVLVHDGNVIVESSVICSYLDEVFPNPPLSPKNRSSAPPCGCGASCPTTSCTWPAPP